MSNRENWSSLVSGGECIVKQYVYFTHICTVSNYLPNVHYCCCVHDAGLLCCRYHQDWNHFRCVESDDLVDTLYVHILDKLTSSLADLAVEADRATPLHFFLPFHPFFFAFPSPF